MHFIYGYLNLEQEDYFICLEWWCDACVCVCVRACFCVFLCVQMQMLKLCPKSINNKHTRNLLFNTQSLGVGGSY